MHLKSHYLTHNNSQIIVQLIFREVQRLDVEENTDWVKSQLAYKSYPKCLWKKGDFSWTWLCERSDDNQAKPVAAGSNLTLSPQPYEAKKTKKKEEKINQNPHQSVERLIGQTQQHRIRMRRFTWWCRLEFDLFECN